MKPIILFTIGYVFNLDLQVGPAGGTAAPPDYDFLFEDSIDFIKSGIIGGEGDFDTAEIAKEKEVKVGM